MGLEWWVEFSRGQWERRKAVSCELDAKMPWPVWKAHWGRINDHRTLYFHWWPGRFSGRDLNHPGTEWSQNSGIMSQSSHLLWPQQRKSGETTTGRLVLKLGLAQRLALYGWRLPSMTIAQLTLIGFQVLGGTERTLASLELPKRKTHNNCEIN